MKTLKTPWLALSLGLAAAGCSDDPPQAPANPLVQQRVALERFESCNELERYIEDTAVADMRRQLTVSGSYFGGRITVDSPPMAEAPVAGDASSAGPGDYTTTNTQVAGVDESDFVKNDGTRIFVLSGRNLFLHTSWPATELSLKGSLEIEGQPQEMLLDEHDRVVIFSSLYRPQWTEPLQEGGAGALPIDCGRMEDCGVSSNATKVTTVNVADLAHPVVLDEVVFPGAFRTSRRIGSSVRLVLNDSFRWPSKVSWWVNADESVYRNEKKLAAAYARLADQNEALIRAQPLDRWLPPGERKLANGTPAALPYRCEDFQRPTGPTELGLVTVATLDLDHPEKEPARTSLIAEVGEVYASAKSLYLVTNHWWWWPEENQQDFTYLHKFDIQDPAHATYVASGTVRGTINDQFSLDEYQDVLRIATTSSRRVKGTTPDSWTFEHTSRVSTLAERDGVLSLLGESAPLANGERIYSARFLGPQGFIVTFRQVDPLFTFDLSDPAKPRQVGELKVPGYSTYIHPIEGGFLLTAGVHVPENGSWNESALKLSLFDVRDLAHPREAFTQTVGSAYSWSEALHEHKAFNYFPAKKLLAIPFTDWDPSGTDYWNNFKSELRVFTVDTAAGFTSNGALSMSDLYRTQGDASWSWYWTPDVRRSVMADDFVYAISDAGVRVAQVDALATPLATSVFRTPLVK